ncbi:MAG: MFS transporter, partial [Actinobacteria bacterium]|nr:MFS transporter [Actinomycetota bacterium]
MNSSNLSPSEEPAGVRLQKVLAGAGFGSRRKCEELIDSGRVSVAGVVVEVQGMRVDPESDVIRVDGKRIAAPLGTVVIAMNKPRGVLTAMSDDRDRRCVG